MKKYLMNIKKWIALEVISNLFLTMASAMFILSQKKLFDYMQKGGTTGIWKYITLLILCVMAILLFSYTNMLFTWKSTVKFEKGLREDFFKKITSYNKEKFYSREIGEYISIQGNDIRIMSVNYLSSVINGIKSVSMFLAYGIIMFINVHWKVSSLIILLSFISVAILPKLTEKKLSDRNKRYTDSIGKLTAKTIDLLNGFKLINKITRRSFNNIFAKYIESNAKIKFLYDKMFAIASIVNDLSIYIINGIAFMITIYLVSIGEITIGTAVAVGGFVVEFTDTIDLFIYSSTNYKSTKKIKEKVEEILKFKFPILKEKNTFDKNIELKNVNIKYDDFEMKNMYYTFEKGKKYAIIGESGSGKSSLMKALIKEKEIYGGTIFFDGININEIDVSPIISYISQEEHIFADDFHNNITCYDSYSTIGFGKIKDLFKKEVLESIKKNSNSASLSGGQKGMIKFIRSYLEDKEVCIFDEIFAGIDIETTNVLKDYILKSNKTVIMITHKLSEDLEGFDQVICLKEGVLANSHLA
ncbi:ABC transporter ATP-binding protein [Clostridiaceae bacterium M8S5]|nr:ABC transporter ATP-binding protein [Clostridiaceae bacterium M8S5]